MQVGLDQFDIDILNQLEKDGKKPFSQIAEDLQISNTMVHQRVNRLKKEGVLSHHSIVIDEKRLGFEWGAFTGITLHDGSDTSRVIEELKGVPEVTECYHISGSFMLFVRIVARNSEHMREVLYHKIEDIKGISKTESMVDFGCAFKRNPPLDSSVLLS
ncbi:MAG: Lrp/AsnC family transcriptional regulator [Bacteroidota bacterium]